MKRPRKKKKKGKQQQTQHQQQTQSLDIGAPAGNLTLADAMDDLKVRFLLSIPEDELKWDRRVFFQLEQAHWYYEDFFADRYATIPHLKLKAFSLSLVRHSGDLFPKAAASQAEFDKVWNQFRAYKGSIPVFGSALLNASCTKVLLVNNWSGKCWGFPRGKVNEGESPAFAAARETHEETGYDATAIINEEDFVERVVQGKQIALYVGVGAPEDYPYTPLVRKEISEVKFWDIAWLCDTLFYNAKGGKKGSGKKKNRKKKGGRSDAQKKKESKPFWNIKPFLGLIAQWVSKRRAHNISRGQQGDAVSNADYALMVAAADNEDYAGDGWMMAAEDEAGYDDDDDDHVGPGGAVMFDAAALEQELLREAGLIGDDGESLDDDWEDEKGEHGEVDALNGTTFGSVNATSVVGDWSAETMFATNEAITGREFTYDGNAQTFGDESERSQAKPGKQQKQKQKHKHQQKQNQQQQQQQKQRRRGRGKQTQTQTQKRKQQQQKQARAAPKLGTAAKTLLRQLKQRPLGVNGFDAVRAKRSREGAHAVASPRTSPRKPRLTPTHTGPFPAFAFNRPALLACLK